ncbi:hypothetical protein CC78DRAFT_570814 [Lojkania enalia]|uniref:Uncharacterized protein n=1 Tax=Lojkania enalia TaxID=147567 RepID=A0A9P4K6N5_9PLEO|nr:hypothetical protein CC78DRAFT_570814 [Didymosphaeria enalia]
MSGGMNTLQGILGNMSRTITKILNKILPPEKRAEIVTKLQQFAVNNPKLAAFITTQIVLTGLPLLLFLTFSLTVFLFSLIAALLIGLVAALLFTVFMVGVALVIVLPTVFMTTFAASFIFLWGLGGYYLLKWFNEGDAPAPEGTAIGDRLNTWTGGRMGWLVDGAKRKQDDKHRGVDQSPKVHGSENGDSTEGGKSTGVAEHTIESKDQATKQVEGVQKRTQNVTNGASGATSTAKGVAG